MHLELIIGTPARALSRDFSARPISTGTHGFWQVLTKLRMSIGATNLVS